MGLRLLAFGESTVNGTGDPDHLGWVGRAVAGRRDITLYNLGIRRETSSELVTRWFEEANRRWTDGEPMRLLFSFGLNDCNPEPSGGTRVAISRSIENAARILEEARQLAPTLMVGPPPPANAAVRDAARALNPQLQSVAQDLDVPYIDVFAVLETNSVWMREAAEWDGAHPDAGGYTAYAALVISDPAWKAFLEI
jgi:acyl-CoA thioesterase-1